MATNSLQSLHHHHHHPLLRHLPTDHSPAPTLPSSLFLRPTTITTTTTLSTTPTTSLPSITHSLSSSTSNIPSTSQAAISYDLLHHHLSSKNFRQADEETRRLLIALAGEPAQKRGYVFFSEAQFIPETDLRAIDELWVQHSNSKFGYSVQKRIWEKANRDFTKFFLKVGWMKKLDTEIEQYNYRSFPNEFTWEMTEDTPEGHLPLTNALRGTQLLSSILSHPAFENTEEEKEETKEVADENGGLMGLRDTPKPMRETAFKPNYSF
ncbi:tetrapyrrole-binding protein, chloroplastic [Malania oleifera]|uniref:tetrapyrrole-binding protein, chloroplastic n=1 Tax=Malania oleifera TaxID=397392 RepID=UPI0025AE96C2|nr:tetrapyrrole-binding protein, chloroplastic [Malania oleifera]